MKNKYSAPILHEEELIRRDVLCDSIQTKVGVDNQTVEGNTLLQYLNNNFTFR